MKTRLIVNCALVVVGLLALVYVVALLAWQFNALWRTSSWVPLPATLLFTEFGGTAPQALATILERMHVGLIFVVPGLVLIALGAFGALRQLAVIRAEKQQREDRLRRIQDYRRQEFGTAAPDGRREPYIGPA